MGADEPEPSLLQYIAVAVETGEASAINAIMKAIKLYVRRGPKGEDWPTILHDWRYTADALKTMAGEWGQGATDIAGLANQSLVRRIQAAGLDVERTLDAPRAWLTNASKIVGREYHVKPSTIRKMWKQRAVLLPEGDRLLAK